MSSFIVEGGKPISGEVTPSGNKNEALPVIAACLLTDEPVTLKRVPKIKDVLTMCDILQHMGCTIEWLGEDQVKIQSKNVKEPLLDKQLCSKIRASILFLGPLLARFSTVSIPLPGGDVIGARRVDTHFEGIETLGGKITLEDHEIKATLKPLKGADLFLDEPSVTGTENLIMLTVLAKGVTTIHNAACEPHVVGLCNLLVAMGAKITGIGTNRLQITGVSKLKGTTHEMGCDFMEAGSFLCLGAIGKGVVKIKNVNVSDLRFTLKTLQRIGINPIIDGNNLIIDGTKPLVMKPEVSGRVGSIYSAPWPAFPTDLMSVAITAATQAQGTIIFHEKMFEGRMFFTDKLMSMGANIVLCDPHRVVITGPTPLSGGFMSSPDVRAGMAMIMAACIAKGTSIIDNIYQVERGYYNIEQKLSSLGVSISRRD